MAATDIPNQATTDFDIAEMAQGVFETTRLELGLEIHRQPLHNPLHRLASRHRNSKA